MIDFFSGSGIVSDVFRKNGFIARSVDINQKLKPDICVNVLNLDLRTLPSSVNFLWFSPDCTYFSRAAIQSHWYKHEYSYRNYVYIPITHQSISAVKLIYKCFSIIDFYPNAFWVIENPVGRLRHLEIIKLLSPFRFSVNYKQWGFDYSKETDLFTNIDLGLSQTVPLCVGKGLRSVNSRKGRSVVPPNLIQFIINKTFNL
jgi:site-specific DNA-cytosine methylase